MYQKHYEKETTENLTPLLQIQNLQKLYDSSGTLLDSLPSYSSTISKACLAAQWLSYFVFSTNHTYIVGRMELLPLILIYIQIMYTALISSATVWHNKRL